MCKGKSTRTSSLVAWGLLTVAALTVFLSYLGSYSTLGSHEVLAAVPAREMLHDGDWIVPRYGGVLRVHKPPLVYWLVAVSGWLFGEFDEFAVRFPSAIAALMLVALMSLWAARWYGRQAAFGAAVVQSTSLWAVNFGRHVEIDMVMCLLTTAAMFLIANQPSNEEASHSRVRWIGILTLIGLTWLAKFQYGATMVFGPVFVFWILQGQWRKWQHFVNPLGLLIVIACMVIWPWFLLRECPVALERWRFETIGRAVGELGYDPWWFFCPELLLFSMPWLFHVLLAAPQSWLRAWKHRDERERFLWIWLIVDVWVISLSPSKHTNYLLAAMPVMTLLACQTFARNLARIHRDALRVSPFATRVLVIAAMAVVITIGAVAPAKWPAVQVGLRCASAVSACGLFGFWWCWQGHRRALAGWVSLASALGVILITLSTVTPQLDRRRNTAEFAKQLRQEVLNDMPVWVYARKGAHSGFHPSIFYLNDPVYQVNTFSELLQQVRQSGELLAVVECESLPRFPAIAPFVELHELARMPTQPGSREPPLVCVRLTDRSDAGEHMANSAVEISKTTNPSPLPH